MTGLLTTLHRVFFKLLSLFIAPFQFIVPKQPNLIILGNHYGFKDNPAYLYQYLIRHHPGLECIWIFKEKSLYYENDCPDNYCYAYSLKGILVQLRANVVVVTNGFGDVSRSFIFSKTILQLWHGTPIKKILLDYKPIGESLLKPVIKTYLKNYSYIAIASDEHRHIYCSAFNCRNDQLLPTGLPRADIILANKKTLATAPTILYAPTWRDNSDDNYIVINSILSSKFIHSVNELGYRLAISLHPKQLASISSNQLDNVELVTGDINTQMSRFSILITDYSSVCFDFALLKRPVIFYCPDLDQYQVQRGLYDYHSDITQGILARNVTELLDHIKRSNLPSPDQLLNYNTFNTGNSSHQLANTIVNIVEKNM